MTEHIELHALPTTSSSRSGAEELAQLDANLETIRVDDNATKSKVRRNYISLSAIAIFLTILSPRSKLWISSSPCMINSSENSSLQRDHNTTQTDGLDYMYRSLRESRSPSKMQQNDQGSCMYYGSLNAQALILPTISIIALLISFFHLQGSNPGVLTKEIMEGLDALDRGEGTSFEDEVELERQTFLEQPSSSSLDLTVQSNIDISEHKHANTLYHSTRRKYCDKCQFYPPLRSHHCSTCNACIATFDHHCHFLGTCIGERNHFRFWVFLAFNVLTSKICLDIVSSSSLTLTAFVYGRGNSVGSSSSSSSDDLQLGLGTTINIIAKLYLYPIFTIASILLIIHTLLVISNGTTFEFTKGAEHIDYLRGTRIMDFPFGREGLFKNLVIFFRRDDAYKSICLRSKASDDNDRFAPIVWKMPDYIDRDSSEWWNHPMENKYWKCC